MINFEQYFPLGQKIILTGAAVKEGLKKAFSSRGYEITNEQFAILMCLWKKDGQSQIELCEKTCKSKPNITRILDIMEKRELIIRHSDENDRRKSLIFLTEYSKEIKEPLMSIALEYGEAVMEGFTVEEMESLFLLLHRVMWNIPEF